MPPSIQDDQSMRVTYPHVPTISQWNPCLRNRNSTYNIKRNSSYMSLLKPDLKRLLDNLPEYSLETEEHLEAIRKRTALLLVTIETMTLIHHNQILENKLTALHKRVIQIKKNQKNNNDKTATK